MKKLLLGMSAIMLTQWSAEAVTLNVKVPEGTKKCYVCGNFNGWNADAAQIMQPAGGNLFTLDLPDVDATAIAGGYKYLCGQDWAYVEKGSNGEEISNRTAPENPDVVGSWASVPEYSVETIELTINGLPRQIKVYLPEGYEESNETYPVIYYNTVQQRYDNAGADGDNGDYFFGTYSWNAQNTMEAMRSQGSPAYIMVQVPSFLAENTVAENPDFMGTGKVSAYYKAFAETVMPYVEENWRVKTGAANTTIVGADQGALFALYASVKHPEAFGNCVAMSPMIWINKSEFLALAADAAAGQTYYISAGSLEPEWMLTDTAALSGALESSAANSFYTVYGGATHNDVAWGESFGSILEAMANGEAPVAPVRTIAAAPAAEIDFADAIYTLYAGPDQNNLEKIGPLTYTEDFRPNGSSSAVAAQVITYDIPASYQSKYYWNVACGPDNNSPWLLSTPGNIGFSSKKTETSWQNITVFEDGSTQEIAAHSKGFRVVIAKESLLMTPEGVHGAKATVKFPGEDKAFTVHFGSVNSASDMGALTPSCFVSDNCIEAEIIYDFNLNKVTVNETKFGESIDKIKVSSFSAVPATATAGTDVSVNLLLNSDCDVELSATRNFNENLGLTFTKVAPGQFHLDLGDTKEGIYTLNVSFVAGGNRLDNAASINVRVLPAGNSAQKALTVNAYEDIDWASTGRYKANFHTHTSRSFDTQFTTSQVVDRYNAAGYEILALTDHDANPYPWSMFDLYTAGAEARYAENLGMLAIPGCELSKDRRNNWSESTGGEFNHHTDLFTGRHGQEFMSLRESYAYTEALGGLQIINHPGQYWNLATEYKNGEKNSPEWHAENFRLYSSLVGLEAYNQGNRRANDRVLWDQILTLTMPERPVWGFSCDDTHTAEQYFRNYQFMLMPELSADALKEALRQGHSIFSYEYTGSGQALCPRIKSINVDENNHTITIDTDDADKIQWISSFHKTGSVASTATNTVVGEGRIFDFTGFRGSYVRALLTNKYGETATQPFGFTDDSELNVQAGEIAKDDIFKVVREGDEMTVICTEGLNRVSVVNAAGMVVKFIECGGEASVSFTVSDLEKAPYIIVASGTRAAYTDKFMKE